MNCRGCNKDFGSYVIPRVMVSCGHTQCNACILKALSEKGVECVTCKKITSVQSIDELPINEAVFDMSRSVHICTTHHQKLSAICEKDNRFLCLSCVLAGQHRNHKITAITDKVKEDKNILRQAHAKIIQAFKSKPSVLMEIQDTILKKQDDFKSYLLQVGVFFKNIKDEIQLQQQKQIERGQREMQNMLKKLQMVEQECKKRMQNDKQALEIYQRLQQLNDIDYLLEEHQRQLIVESSKQKKLKIPYQVLQFNRRNSLQELLKQIQQIAAYERKKVLYTNMQTSPLLKKHTSKQTTILEVNLNEEYHRRKAKKMRPAKSTITIQTDREPQPIKNDTNSNLLHDMNQSFTPVSIRSFMHSFLDKTFNIERSPSMSQISIKQSFTVCDINTKIYHVGGKGKINNSNILALQTYNIQNEQTDEQQFIKQWTESQSLFWKHYSPTKIIIFQRDSLNNKTSISQFDWRTGEIQESKLNILKEEFNFEIIVDNKSLIAFGGYTHPSNKVRKFQWVKNEMKQVELPCMGQERSEFKGIRGYDGRIYACGGMNKLVLSGCERLNLQQSRWEHVGYMREARMRAAMIATPDGIYAIGGHNGKNPLKSVEYLNYDTGKWIEIQQMPIARCDHTAVLILEQQIILVFGGFDVGPLDNIVQYDIKLKKWSPKGKMKQPRYGHCSLLPL